MTAIDPHIVETWVRGWTLARETPPPTRYRNALRVYVGWPRQMVRYVFPSLDREFHFLAEAIVEPWIFLKVCAPPDAVREYLPDRWVIQPAGFMMRCHGKMIRPAKKMTEEYTLECMQEDNITTARLLTTGKEVAAIGRVVQVDSFAVYDRIETHPDHRRRGLASFIMKALENAAGKQEGLLVATGEGRSLYETLGWRLYTPYTSVVIPG